MKKEIIGILICTLLISVAVAPVINALDNEINEVNNLREPTETFGLQDTDPWEQTVNDLLARFEAAQTQESKIAVLEEIPVIMDIYGLLPEDMTIEEAQKLIVTAYLETIASGSPETEQSNFAEDSLLMVNNNIFTSNSAQFQVSKSNRINNIKLDPPQPAEWPPESKCVSFGFGRISNFKREFNGDEYYSSFNCENVICKLGDGTGQWYHYTNGEKLYINHVLCFINRKDNFFLVLF